MEFPCTVSIVTYPINVLIVPGIRSSFEQNDVRFFTRFDLPRDGGQFGYVFKAFQTSYDAAQSILLSAFLSFRERKISFYFILFFISTIIRFKKNNIVCYFFDFSLLLSQIISFSKERDFIVGETWNHFSN